MQLSSGKKSVKKVAGYMEPIGVSLFALYSHPQTQFLLHVYQSESATKKMINTFLQDLEIPRCIVKCLKMLGTTRHSKYGKLARRTRSCL
jgi:hypothetical protein